MTKKKDIERRFLAFQKTMDFHLMEVQGLLPNCVLTLIVRDTTNDDISVIYSNEEGGCEKALKSAVKKMKEKRIAKSKNKE